MTGANSTATLEAAVDDLRAADPVMAALIDRLGADSLGDPRRGRTHDHYGSLIRSIVGQQVSTQSAAAIYRRLTERYGGRTPSPQEVLAEDPETLRAAAGLSHAKLAYLRSLAEHIVDGSLELDNLDRLTDEQIMAELLAVKGIGPWTAQTFLMFHLAAARRAPGRRPRDPPRDDAAIRARPPCRRRRTWSGSPTRGAPIGPWPAGFCGARCTRRRCGQAAATG